VWFVYGNIDKDVAVSTVKGASETLKLKPISKEEVTDCRAVCIPKNDEIQRLDFENEDAQNENSVFVSYF
jgi:hypothetical protein